MTIEGDELEMGKRCGKGLLVGEVKGLVDGREITRKGSERRIKNGKLDVQKRG